MAISKAQQKAVNKYVREKYDRVLVTFSKKGKKDIIKAHAEGCGESVNGFINRAIDEAMERDTSQQPVGAPVRAANPLEGKFYPRRAQSRTAGRKGERRGYPIIHGPCC